MLTADTITDARLPSVAQMATRSQSIHRNILNAIADGQIERVTAWLKTPGDIRGYSRARGTLRRWACLSNADGSLTERGRQLRDVLNARAKEAK